MLARFLAQVAAEARGKKYARECAAWALERQAAANARADAYARQAASWAFDRLGEPVRAAAPEIGAPGAAQAQGGSGSVQEAWDYLRTRGWISLPASPDSDPGRERSYVPPFASETALGRRP